MNQQSSTERIFGIAVVLIASFTIGIVCCSGQSISSRELLGGSHDCSQVIGMIHQYGVNRSCDRSTGNRPHYDTQLGPMIIPANETGDLRILSVHQIGHTENSCGPKIAVVIENASQRCVEQFSVTAVATLGRIQPFSPNSTVVATKIEPGTALQVELSLPLEALAMGNRNGTIVGFERLVVAIDSFDELAETDEANNVRAYSVGDLAIVAPTAAPQNLASNSELAASMPASTQTKALESGENPNSLLSAIETFSTTKN